MFITFRPEPLIAQVLAVAAGLCAVAQSETAAAHAPLASEIWTGPSGTTPTVRVAGFGVIQTSQALGTPNYTCNRLLGIEAPDPEQPMLACPDGSLLRGTPEGLVRFDSVTCVLTPVQEGLAPGRISALAQSPDLPGRLFIVAGETPAVVYLSDDCGAHWQEQAALDVDLEHPVRAMAVAPGAPSTVVLTHDTPTSHGYTDILTSLDDGQTFSSQTVLGTVDVLHVEATSPLRTWLVSADENTRETRVLLREGALGTVKELHRVQYFGGMAIAHHNRHVWVGEAIGGLFRSDNGAPFEQVQSALAPSCLTYDPHSASLWACTAGLSDTPSMAVSRDGGDSWSGLLAFADVTAQSQCPSEADAESQCKFAWAEWTSDVLRPSAPRPAPPKGLSDGGAPDSSTPDDDHRTDGGVGTAQLNGAEPNADSKLASDATVVANPGAAQPPPGQASPATCSISGSGPPRQSTFWPCLMMFAAALGSRIRRQVNRASCWRALQLAIRNGQKRSPLAEARREPSSKS